MVLFASLRRGCVLRQLSSTYLPHLGGGMQLWQRSTTGQHPAASEDDGGSDSSLSLESLPPSDSEDERQAAEDIERWEKELGEKQKEEEAAFRKKTEIPELHPNLIASAVLLTSHFLPSGEMQFRVKDTDTQRMEQISLSRTDLGEVRSKLKDFVIQEGFDPMESGFKQTRVQGTAWQESHPGYRMAEKTEMLWPDPNVKQPKSSIFGPANRSPFKDFIETHNRLETLLSSEQETIDAVQEASKSKDETKHIRTTTGKVDAGWKLGRFKLDLRNPDSWEYAAQLFAAWGLPLPIEQNLLSRQLQQIEKSGGEASFTDEELESIPNDYYF
ncbi:unnamed protein product [Amoebophrya sp. A25]|nr:unnamed protein product [Amoebophrya sp. A25]|eukprot:GSA25T00003433001.1